MSKDREHSAYVERFEEYAPIVDFELIERFSRDGVLMDTMTGLFASEDRLNASIREQGINHPVGVSLLKSPLLEARSFDAKDKHGRWSGIAIDVGFVLISQIYFLALEYIWGKYTGAVGLINDALNDEEAVASIQSIWPTGIDPRASDLEKWDQLQSQLFAAEFEDCGQLLLFARFAPLLSVEYLLLHEFAHVRLGHPTFWSVRLGYGTLSERARQDYSVDDSEILLALELAADRSAALMIAEFIAQEKSILIPVRDGYSRSDLMEGWAVALITQMMLIGLTDSQDVTEKIFGFRGYPHPGFRLRVLCDTIEERLSIKSPALAQQWHSIFVMSHALICRIFSIGTVLKNPELMRRINPNTTIAVGPGPYDFVKLYDPDIGFSADSEMSFEKASKKTGELAKQTHKYSGIRTDSFTF